MPLFSIGSHIKDLNFYFHLTTTSLHAAPPYLKRWHQGQRASWTSLPCRQLMWLIAQLSLGWCQWNPLKISIFFPIQPSHDYSMQSNVWIKKQNKAKKWEEDKAECRIVQYSEFLQNTIKNYSLYLQPGNHENLDVQSLPSKLRLDL